MLVEQAVAAGYDVTAFARTPSKIKVAQPSAGGNLRVVQGDIQDAAAVERAVAGADAVISVLGPSSNAPELRVSQGMQNILQAMRKHGVRRLILSTGAGVRMAGDQPKFMDHVIVTLLKLVSKNVLQDMVNTVKLVQNSDRDWTIVRVPMLTDDPAQGNLRTGAVGKDIGTRLGRADLAAFLLQQVKDDRYLRQTPAISN